MAITAKIRMSGEDMKAKSSLTPEEIRDRLFYFRDAAHDFHHQTKGGWEHDALGKLYEALDEFADDITEELMGYMDGKRLGGLMRIPAPKYGGHESSVKLVKDLMDFAYELYEYGGEKKFCSIENRAQDLSGLGAKTIYRLTLS
jgi:hypothetical protein